jgi:hypothetical protein
LTCLNWNANNINCSGRELALANLLAVNDVDIASITETELNASSPLFEMDGYTTFAPLVDPGAKTRVLLLIRSTIATRGNAKVRLDLMSSSVPTVWVQMGAHEVRKGGRTARHSGMLFAAVYRVWTDSEKETGKAVEWTHLSTLIGQVERAATSKKGMIILGDFNLDTAREHDAAYQRRDLLTEFVRAMAANGLEYFPTPPTWYSYGKFTLPSGMEGRRCSVIDHCYVSGLKACARLLDDATTDHRPILLEVNPGKITGDANVPTVLRRQNFKAIDTASLEAALEANWDWSAAHKIRDVDKVHEFILAGITAALDEVAPLREIRVKSGSNLYLTRETLEAIRVRDNAKGDDYAPLRNKATKLVRRDKLRCNEDKLAKSGNDGRILWELANSALGKQRPTLPASLTLPDGTKTVGDNAAANAMNGYFNQKVLNLREKIADAPPAPTPSWPPLAGRGQPSFSFSFASAGKIAKVIKNMGSTEAIGVDGIPTSVLKKGASVLASPIAHLINRSLAEGIVPAGFKVGQVHPVHKGSGKSRADPASYRPVSILPALSKIIEAVVKADLEKFLAANNILPASQFGFRRGRSCTMALGTAHAGWLKGVRAGKVVGVMAFDLSAAFDTVAAERLLPKLERIGIRGKALSWFAGYLSGGKQCVVWNGAISSYVDVEFGVRQGSLLGPVLFIIHVADMQDFVGVDENGNVVYADDSNLWEMADTWEAVKSGLELKAAKFAHWAKGNGLAMNAAKTQLLVTSNAGASAGLTVVVEGSNINCSKTLELLGVTYDRKLSTAPHVENMAKAARQRSALIARLAQHLPRGRFLRQLANGLVIGKLSHAIAAVAAPRLAGSDMPIGAGLRSVQIAINDTARSITGCKRSDHIEVHDLIARAGLPTMNELITRSIALETWTAFNSSDGNSSGGRNPLGSTMFDGSGYKRDTRAAAAGIVQDPLRGYNTLVSNGIGIWNEWPELRAATTRGSAKRIAAKLAKSVPL